MFLLLTDNASPGSSDGMMPGFLVEDGGGMEKLVIVAISLILRIFYPWTGKSDGFVYMNDVDAWYFYFSNLGRKCIIHLKNGLC